MPDRISSAREIVGLVPAAGQATRISPLPCSKELFPVCLREESTGARPKVVSHFLLEKMRRAGASKTYIVLRNGKWDIPAYFGNGAMLGMDLAYLVVDPTPGPPYTLDQAFPFVKEALVLFGFPDILFEPGDAFGQLLERQAQTQADVVLGLFLAHQPEIMDMVETDEAGRVRNLLLKPGPTRLREAWLMAVWTPAFTAFLHQHLAACGRPNAPAMRTMPSELTVGHVLQAAAQEGLCVQSVAFPNHSYLDIGTPEALARIFRGEALLGRDALKS